MAGPHPTEARFPGVPAAAGLYESFYLKSCHPDGGLGVWIRYTVHKRPGAEAKGSLWFTLFDSAADGPRAQKVTLPSPGAAGGDWIRVGEASMREGAAAGAIGGVGWELRFQSTEAPLFHLPRDWMYRTPIPRTKLLSPVPAARFDGSLQVDGRTVAVDGWRGMIGHNWGAQHAERWIWLHGMSGDDWLDAAIAKLRLGPLTTPWIANGVLSIAGKRLALGGPRRRVRVRESPERCELVLPGAGVRLRGTVTAARKDVVGWLYADPDGSEHHTTNCSICDMRLTVERSRAAEPRDFAVDGAGAYELGMRERDHGVPIQPFPDG